MQEEVLQFLWQYQLFNTQNLTTACEQSIEVFSQGFKNKNSGADFSNAKIKLGDIKWHGDIEIHIYSSDWYKHKHHDNPAFNNVILHVVWEHDKEAKRNDGSTIPTLMLKNKIPSDFLAKHQNLMAAKSIILCEKHIHNIKTITIYAMLDRVLAERLNRKSRDVLETLKKTDYDWEETTYRVIAENFGFKINKDPFKKLAESLPLKILLKHADNLLQIEALLFGQAGFLDDECNNEYFKELKKEYSFLAQKYNLQKTKTLKQEQWKFLRTRPNNFPTIRIAQFSAFISSYKNLFSFIINIGKNKRKLNNMFNVRQSKFWKENYHFNTSQKSNVNTLGKNSIENVIINSFAPILSIYSKEKEEYEYFEKAIWLLQNISAERNHIINKWKAIGVNVKSAFDSQALLELHNEYCLKSKCLSCSIGIKIIRH